MPELTPHQQKIVDAMRAGEPLTATQVTVKIGTMSTSYRCGQIRVSRATFDALKRGGVIQLVSVPLPQRQIYGLADQYQ